MTSKNIGYVYEVAGMQIAAERAGDYTPDLIHAAIRNGATRTQLRDARNTLLGLQDNSDDAIRAYVHRVYVEDGLRNGYVRPDDKEAHSTWVLGQMAAAFHGQ